MQGCKEENYKPFPEACEIWCFRSHVRGQAFRWVRSYVRGLAWASLVRLLGGVAEMENIFYKSSMKRVALLESTLLLQCASTRLISHADQYGKGNW